MPDPKQLQFVYEGWEGYNRSLMNAAIGLTSEQLAFKGHAEMRSVGELFWHIGNGRIDWLSRIDPEGFSELSAEMQTRTGGYPDEFSATETADWLRRTWRQVSAMLDRWTVEDLPESYEQPYQGKVYGVSRQWVIWRIMAHDIHHGGQLTELLAMQGVFPFELTHLGGHLTEPPILRS